MTCRLAFLAPAPGALLLVTLAAAGCASESTAPDRQVSTGFRPNVPSNACEATHRTPRPFGRRFVHFWDAYIAGTPPRLAHRSAKEWEATKATWDRFTQQTGKEVDKTGHRLANLPGEIANDARSRREMQSYWMENRWQRLKRDTDCFLDRFWYGIKILE